MYTFTVAVQPTAPPFADEVPQLLAVVELTEGVRLSTTLVDVDPAAITIGMAVAPVFDHGDDGITLLRFRPPAELQPRRARDRPSWAKIPPWDSSKTEQD